jgi:N-acylneuraminate cytidylyltransferase
MNKHIAVIPARAGSVGLPGKNRMFFDATADFIEATPWLNRILVTSDDNIVLDKAKERGFECIRRPSELAGPDVSIRSTFEHLLSMVEVDPEDVLWLFYLPVVYKDITDFELAKELIENEEHDSLIGLFPAASHPYSCWRIDEAGGLYQYINNDVYRRQDMPAAWTHHHYISCFRRRAFESLNSELIGSDTRPVILKDETLECLIEIDTPEDWERWMQADHGHR